MTEPSTPTSKNGKTRRRRSVFRKFLLVIIILFVICLLGAGAIFYISGFSFANSLTITASLLNYGRDTAFKIPPFNGKQRINILLLGVDEPFGGASRSDTIKLISLDFSKKRIGMISIPRDTWVTLPNGKEGRINSAHQLGGTERKKCVRMAEETVSGLLSDIYGNPVNIDRYVRVQTVGFVKIIDALGGIDIEVDKQMDYEDPSQQLFIHLKPGMQHLDGRQAVGYVRFRHDAEGDYGRIKRQDNFLRVLAAKINQPDGQHQLIKLIGPLLDMVSTDLSVKEAKAIKELIGKIGKDNIESVELPTVPTYKGAAAVVEIQDRATALRAVNELFNGLRPRVLVLNGTGQNLPRAFSESINADYYNIIGVRTTKTPADACTIFTVGKCRTDAETLAQQLGLPANIDTVISPPDEKKEKRASTLTTPAQITILLGKDYLSTTPADQQATFDQN